MVGGLIVFGDGMHQTDGATLYCMKADSGVPLWQLPFPGHLIHLEGAVTVDNGRVYSGGGNAGVFCVDAMHVNLDGRAQELSAVQPAIEKRWAELLVKFEEDKKKDANLAVPPSEDALPKPAPNLLWQQGKDKWHVDVPVLVTGGKVFAASAYLDDDKCGDRALICLNSADGGVRWEVPLKINPWGGPTLAGDLVLVACSSIRFDKKLVPSAKGEIVAIDFNSGQVRWRKDVAGGVLSTVAVKKNLAVFTATDGKIRAWDIASGAEKWVYDGKAPFFAGAAIAGDMIYAADLAGILHCISLADGKRNGRWMWGPIQRCRRPVKSMAPRSCREARFISPPAISITKAPIKAMSWSAFRITPARRGRRLIRSSSIGRKRQFWSRPGSRLENCRR